MKRYLVVLCLTIAALSGATSYAHHSFAATYLQNETITFEGELVQFQFRNPHSFVHLNVTEKDGTVHRYSVEWAGSAQLGGAGVNQGTLKVGDKVTITGRPGRSFARDRRVLMVTLKATGLDWGRKPGEKVD